MKYTLLFVTLAALALLAAGAGDFQFVMRMRGGCIEQQMKKGTYDCHFKGNSQVITTRISSTDAVQFSVKEAIGSYAEALSTAVLTSEGHFKSAGNITFGAHNARDHMLYYGLTGLKPFNNVAVADGPVTGGTGGYKDAHGVISETCDRRGGSHEWVCFIVVVLEGHSGDLLTLEKPNTELLELEKPTTL